MNPAPTAPTGPVGRDFDVLLADGTTAHVRDIRPEDAEALIAFHGGLSPETVVFRFFGPHPVLSEREVKRFTNVDGADRVALVAERADRMIAVARYDRAPGRDEAEVAFVVADAFQGRGIGTTLLEHLVVTARQHGIKRFVAETLLDNHRMIQVLRDAGFTRHSQGSRGVVRVVLDISPNRLAEEAAEERDRRAVVSSMERLLRPRSIAVIGAARAVGTIGHQLLQNLLSGGFEGTVYPVNPAATHVASVPCWPSVGAIPEPVDLAVIAVPAAKVETVVEDCGRKGVGALVVISAGFAEIGTDGARLQHELVRLAHSYGMRMLGPNCFGVANTAADTSMNATFAPSAPSPGDIGFVSQSGGLGIALLREISLRGLGISAFVSTGNKADISGNDLLRWWEQDPATKVVLMYLESFGNPRRFVKVASLLSRSKPIVAVKSGRSAAGTRGAASHTAALASPEEAVGALFRKTGVVRVDTIEEMFDVAQVLDGCPLPAGNRVAILTNAGGPGVLAADACAGFGLEVPELAESTQKDLRSFLDPSAAARNPVDMIASASADTYRQALGLLLEGRDVDAVIVIFTPPLVTRADDVAAAVIGAAGDAYQAGSGKPVLGCFLGSEVPPTSLGQGDVRVPLFAYPEAAARALSRAFEYSRWRARPEEPEPVLDGLDTRVALRVVEGALAARPPAVSDDHGPQAAGSRGTAAVGWITGAAAMELLDSYGIPTVPTVAVTSATEAQRAARELGGPVALKATGVAIVHKSDVGGVKLALGSPEDVSDAYRSMQRDLGSAMDGAVLQKMVPGGVETIAGFVRHRAFGPLVLFGLGGTAVELLGDHASALAPLTTSDATELVHSLRGSRLLTGFRGSPPVDVDALVDLLLRLGRLAADLPELAEADCNPVIAGPIGVTVVDARVRVAESWDGPGPEPRHL